MQIAARPDGLSELVQPIPQRILDIIIPDALARDARLLLRLREGLVQPGELIDALPCGRAAVLRADVRRSRDLARLEERAEVRLAPVERQGARPSENCIRGDGQAVRAWSMSWTTRKVRLTTAASDECNR